MKISSFQISGAILLASIVILGGCGNNNDIPLSKNPEIIKLAAPIRLQTDSTVIWLQDYFNHPLDIDSIKVDNSFKYSISADTATLTLTPASRNIPRLSEMKVWIGGFSYSIILEKSQKIWQHISFDPKEKRYKKVQIAGDMNDWNPSKNNLKLKDKIWETDILLFPGKYQYKFVLDGKYILDPANHETVDNNVGGSNSLMYAGSINPPGAPILFTNKMEKNAITLGIKNKTTDAFIFWQNYRLSDKFYKFDSAGLTITIPKKAADFDRSFLRVWAYNSAGNSNSILVPLAKGKVVTDPTTLTRSDKEAMILYFMMVDRFRNGDKKNDAPLKDKEVDPRLNFQGGDLTGIQEKMDDGYISDLGVNSLWISPVTLNPPDAWNEYPEPHRKFSGYHGYWPVTLTTIDPRFGSTDEMNKLVTTAHDKKMNVILDYVSNHVHQSSAIYKQHPDYATPLILPNKQKNIRLWNEQRLTTWFDEFLPTLDLARPEVCNMMSDSAAFVLKEFKLDGFRHDAAKHVPEVYWRTLTKKIKDQVEIPENRSVYQIGETFGSRDLIGSYINPGKLDAQFDFSVYFDAINAFGKEQTSLKDLNYSIQESFNYFGNHHLMGNISGNQDLTRFISLASGAVSWNENAGKAGWDRDIQVKDTIGYHRLASLMAFNMTIPGIPVIYYGDEIGMPGAGDPDNRRMMRFDSLTKHEKWMLGITRQLTHLRSSSLPLIFGDLRTIEVTDKTWVFMRTYFDKVVFVVFNKDNKPRKIDFDIPDRFNEAKLIPHFGNEFKMDQKKVTLTVKGNSFEIITN
ncbi:MAG: alpha-amylase family glycosyl hydrolase [Bacteroidota bacterium]